MPQAWLVEIKKLFSKLPLDAAEDEKRPGTSALPVRQAIARRWREIRDTCKGTVKELHKLRRGLCDQLHQLVQSYGAETPFAPQPSWSPSAQAALTSEEPLPPDASAPEDDGATPVCPNHCFRFLSNHQGVWTVVQALGTWQ